MVHVNVIEGALHLLDPTDSQIGKQERMGINRRITMLLEQHGDVISKVGSRVQQRGDDRGIEFFMEIPWSAVRDAGGIPPKLREIRKKLQLAVDFSD